MKRLAFLLAMLLVFSLTTEAFATSRALTINPKLSFSETTANCNVTIMGDTASDHLKVTMKLLYGNRILASWTSEGYGYVAMRETTTVSTGKTYKLLVEVIANGVAKDPVYVTGTC